MGVDEVALGVLEDSQELNSSLSPSESAGSAEHSDDASTAEINQDVTPAPVTPSQRKPFWLIRILWLPFLVLRALFRSPEDVSDGRFKELVYEKVDDYPRGYPHWAAHLNSDPTFRLYRRYGTLRNRTLLYKQQELSELEVELYNLDKEDETNNSHRVLSHKGDRNDEKSKRSDLMKTIEEKLKEYDDLLEREAKSAKMQKPPKRQYRNLVNYLWNFKPVPLEEMQFLNPRDDFIMLTPEPDSPLERTLDNLICMVPIRRFKNLFSSDAQANKINDSSVASSVTRTSGDKLIFITRVFASLLAVCLITVPLYFLSSDRVSNETKLLTLVLAFFLFTVAIQIAARPRNHELFAATAAYCAVLSTFLATSGNFNSSSSQPQYFNNATSPG